MISEMFSDSSYLHFYSQGSLFATLWIILNRSREMLKMMVDTDLMKKNSQLT